MKLTFGTFGPYMVGSLFITKFVLHSRLLPLLDQSSSKLILSRMPTLWCGSARQDKLPTTLFEYETFSDFTKWRLS